MFLYELLYMYISLYGTVQVAVNVIELLARVLYMYQYISMYTIARLQQYRKRASAVAEYECMHASCMRA